MKVRLTAQLKQVSYMSMTLAVSIWLIIPFVLPSVWSIFSPQTTMYQGELFVSPAFAWTWRSDPTVTMFKLNPRISLRLYKPELIKIGPKQIGSHDLALWQDRYAATLNSNNHNNNARPFDIKASNNTVHCVEELYDSEYESIFHCVDDDMIFIQYFGPKAHVGDFYKVVSTRRPSHY